MFVWQECTIGRNWSAQSWGSCCCCPLLSFARHCPPPPPSLGESRPVRFYVPRVWWSFWGLFSRGRRQERIPSAGNCKNKQKYIKCWRRRLKVYAFRMIDSFFGMENHQNYKWNYGDKTIIKLFGGQQKYRTRNFMREKLCKDMKGQVILFKYRECNVVNE